MINDFSEKFLALCSRCTFDRGVLSVPSEEGNDRGSEGNLVFFKFLSINKSKIPPESTIINSVNAIIEFERTMVWQSPRLEVVAIL